MNGRRDARRFSCAALGVAFALASVTGCGWLSDLGVPREIREKGLLDALRKPMPLDEPMPIMAGLTIEHASELRAAEERLEEFIAGLEDPTLRAAHAQSLRDGGPSRTETFFELLFMTRVGGMGGDERLRERWRRLDRALARGDEPELREERIQALAAFVAQQDADGAARLTEAIRDDWNPESRYWSSVIAFADPGDAIWRDAWETASRKDLDNALGRAILDRFAAGEERMPVVHPFASPKGLALLERMLREPSSSDESYDVVQQLSLLDDESRDELWQAARSLPPGPTRIHAAETMLRLTNSGEAVASLVEAGQDERHAVAAWNALSRKGRLDRSTLPTGDVLARSKAYGNLRVSSALDEEAKIELFPLASSQVRWSGQEFLLAAFRYRVTYSPAEVAAGAPATEDGVCVVDDRLVLDPKEEPDSSAASPAIVEEPSPIDRDLDPETIAASRRDHGAQTLLDLLILDVLHGEHVDPYLQRDALRADLLDQDVRWKAFDLPLDSLGFPTTALDPNAIEAP